MRILEAKSSHSSRNLVKNLHTLGRGIYLKTICFLGQKQSGKTWAVKESLWIFPKPIIAIDMVGRLTEYVEDEGIDAFVVEINAWSQDLWNTVQKCLRNRENLVIYCNMTQSEKGSFMDNLSVALMSQYRRFVLEVDEIHEVLPQNRGIYSEEFDRLIRTGANKQIGVVFTTQRPAIVNKDILSLADNYLIFRQVWGGDLKSIGKLLEYHMDTSEQVNQALKEIAGFTTGEHAFYSFSGR